MCKNTLNTFHLCKRLKLSWCDNTRILTAIWFFFFFRMLDEKSLSTAAQVSPRWYSICIGIKKLRKRLLTTLIETNLPKKGLHNSVFLTVLVDMFPFSTGKISLLKYNVTFERCLRNVQCYVRDYQEFIMAYTMSNRWNQSNRISLHSLHVKWIAQNF